VNGPSAGAGAARPGMESRLRTFGRDVYFFTPSLKHYRTDEVSTPADARFVPISVTGSSCRLMCDHCGAGILESMIPALDPEALLRTGARLAARGVRGLLLTGGSDERGVVPLRPFAEAMRRLREEHGLTVIVHTGLVDDEDVGALMFAGVDAAMMDVIGDDATVRDVYHLDAGVSDFAASLARLVDSGIPTAPHVVVGIDRGRIVGERAALRLVARHAVASLVLVVLSPIPGTPMEHARPPGAAEVADLFDEARALFPTTPVLLGCARPEGEVKAGIDRAALEGGLNGIAFPAEGTVALAESMGLKPVFSDDCCALIFREVSA
jgi:uncharacterized radical SAM superfamily protein